MPTEAEPGHVHEGLCLLLARVAGHPPPPTGTGLPLLQPGLSCKHMKCPLSPRGVFVGSVPCSVGPERGC